MMQYQLLQITVSYQTDVGILHAQVLLVHVLMLFLPWDILHIVLGIHATI